jgi:thiamine biosynthesis lipoprotein
MSTTTERRGPSRREFLAFGVGAFAVTAFPFAEWRRGRVIRRTMPVMGTIAQIAVVSRDERHAHAAIDAAMDELTWVERTMTRFTDTSDIGRANLGADGAPVRVTPETARVVREALAWADVSDGAYDPAVGGVIKLWDVNHRHEPPSSDQLVRLANRRLYRHVEVDTWQGGPVLRYHEGDARLDLGAVAKGYAVDRATGVLRRWGITKAVVCAGGDLYALGTSVSGDPWRIGIRDPNDVDGVIQTLDVSDAAVATSGTYVQFFRWRGRRYHHLLDPSVAAPRATAVQSLTVRADCCMHADVASTTLFGMESEAAKRVLALRAPGASVILTV